MSHDTWPVSSIRSEHFHHHQQFPPLHHLRTSNCHGCQKHIANTIVSCCCPCTWLGHTIILIMVNLGSTLAGGCFDTASYQHQAQTSSKHNVVMLQSMYLLWAYVHLDHGQSRKYLSGCALTLQAINIKNKHQVSTRFSCCNPCTFFGHIIILITVNLGSTLVAGCCFVTASYQHPQPCTSFGHIIISIIIVIMVSLASTSVAKFQQVSYKSNEIALNELSQIIFFAGACAFFSDM